MRSWLKDYREKMNLSQTDVSILCGCSKSAYSYIESGKRTPSVKMAKQIAKHLRFKWPEFFNLP